MDFNYDDNQKMLFDSVDRFLTDKYDLAKRARLLDDPAGTDAMWREMAELGWIGAAFPEDAGGFASSPVDTMVVAERLGRHLVTQPYVITAVVCGRMLMGGLPEADRNALLEQVIAGDMQLAPALGGNNCLHSPEHDAFTAKPDGAGYILNGRMSVVLNADRADKLIVAARTSGANGDREGVSLFLVDANAPGVVRRGFRMIDAHGAAEVILENVSVGAECLVGGKDQAVSLVDVALDHGVAAACGEALGSMSHLVQATAEYTRTREQYGAPLAKFQVLQHRMADMYIQTETARSMTYLASMSLEEDAVSRMRELSAAKIQVARSGKFVGYQAVQLHGGMGVTEELDIGHHYIRLNTIARLFGDQAFHLRRFADMSDLIDAA